MQKYDTYLSSIKERLTTHFDITAPAYAGGRNYDLSGVMNISNAKYLLTEKMRIYGYDNDEYLWLRRDDGEEALSLEEELADFKKLIPEVVKPRKDHMSSLLSLVIITEKAISGEWERLARRFRHQKGFALGFRGWADLILVIVSLEENRVVTHRNFMKTAAFFQPEKICQKERT